MEDNRNSDNQLCAEVNVKGDHLLQTGNYSDCKFLVGIEPEQEEIKGHKLLLAMASCVFATMFFGDYWEKTNPIKIVDMHPETFKQLLQYIYTGKANMKSTEEACNLYYAAKKYMMQSLLEECSKYLWIHVKPSNVWQVFEFAQLYEDKELLLKCEKIFSTATMDVLNDSKFEDAELSTVLTIFSYDNLNISSETDLIIAAARYAKAHNIMAAGSDDNSADDIDSFPPHTSNGEVNEVHAKTQDVDDSSNQVESGSQANAEIEESRPNIRRIAEKIRFLSLSPQQFAECPERASILTLEEEHAVIMNLVSKNSNVPMPSDFSTSTLARNTVELFKEAVILNEDEDEPRMTGMFRYKVSNFSNVANTSSPPYYLRHLAWRLLMSRDARNGRKISVQCIGKSDQNWSSVVRLRLTVISRDIENFHHCILNDGHIFCKDSSTFHFLGMNFIDWDRYRTDDGAVCFELHIEEVHQWRLAFSNDFD